MSGTLRSQRLFEPLEQRLLFSGAPWKLGEVSADWFSSFQTIDGPIAPGSSANQLEVDVEHSWIVQLNASALAQLGDVAEVPQVFESAHLPVRPVRGLGLTGQLVVEGFVDRATTEAALRGSTLVAHLSLNGVIQGTAEPNDPLFVKQIALNGLNDRDIDAPEAWRSMPPRSQGSQGVVVAVIDSGIDYGHPDLADNMWKNPGNLRDAKGKPLMGGLHGYDFANGDADPMDDNGHGTNVAGIIGAEGNNGIGITGVNWATSLVAIKYLNKNNVGTQANGVLAVNYATELRNAGVNLQVINASWGNYGDFDQGMYEAIEAAGNAGILFVAAAGNGNTLGRGIDLDQERSPFYPASYDLNNIISVGALGKDGKPATFSNFGKQSVDLLAPGESIFTTDRSSLYNDPARNAYTYRNGTSFAAPFVSGTAALVVATKPGSTVAEIRDAVLSGTKQTSSLGNVVASSGVLSAKGALEARTFAPRAMAMAIPDVTQPGKATVTVTFTSIADLDPTSIMGAEVQLNRIGFKGSSRLAKILPQSLDINRQTISATYESDAFNSEANGSYEVVLLGERVRNVTGLAAAQRKLATFTVKIQDPNVILVKPAADLTPGSMTLRAAVRLANTTLGMQTILLSDGNYVLSAAGTFTGDDDAAAVGDLDITDKLKIIGSGSSFNTIDANKLHRVFDVQSGGALDLQNVTVTGGKDSEGAAIRNASKVLDRPGLRVYQSVIKDSIGTARGGALANLKDARARVVYSTIEGNLGGAVYNAGAYLLIYSSTISGNSAATTRFTTEGKGGGVFNDATGTLDVSSSTFSGNAASQGGGIYNAGTATIARATIVDNQSFTAGGIFSAPGKSVTIRSSVVARNNPATNDVDGAFSSLGYNFIGRASAAATGFTATGDRVNSGVALLLGPLAVNVGLSNPILAPLLPNHGPIKTHMPLPGSPLIDKGAPNEIPDQVGIPADPNGAPLIYSRADIGAAERFLGVLTGIAYNDLNGDGSMDPDESGLPDAVKVFLDFNKNSIFDRGENFVFTSAGTGRATVNVLPSTVLPPGFDLRVTLVTPAGYEPTAPGDNSTTFRSLAVTSPVTLTTLADTLNGIDGLPLFRPLSVAVDADGSVAFAATSLTSFESILYVGADNSFATVGAGGAVDTFGYQLDSGLVSFVTSGGSRPRGVYLGQSDGLIQAVATDTTAVPLGTESFGNVDFKEPRLSNGQVLFHTERAEGSTSITGVYAGSEESTLMRLVDSTMGFGDHFLDADLERDDFAFLNRTGIFLQVDGSAITSVVSPTQPVPGGTGLFDFSQPTALALSGGKVTFFAHGSQGEWGLFRVGLDGSVTPVADLRTLIPEHVGIFTGFGSEISADGNNAVFVGQGLNNFRGVYCSIDGQLRKIIDTTQKFQGSNIVSFNLGSDALSENRIAFTATLADGRRVVMQASIPFVHQRSVVVSPGEQVLDLNFGFRALPSTVVGNVFEDQDADNLPDSSDLPLSGWTVFLFVDQNNNQMLDSADVEQAAVQTNNRGDYVFSNLSSPQTYFVRLQVPGDYKCISPAGATKKIELQPDQVTTVDFATRKKIAADFGVGNGGSLKGRIYEDRNGNKRFDAGEGQAGWFVFDDVNESGIRDDGEAVGRTDINGFYQLVNLGPGKHNVRVPIQSGFELLTPKINALTQTELLPTVTNPNGLTLGVLHTVLPGDPTNPALDLAIVSKTNNSLQILRNNGTGAFKTQLTLAGIGSVPNVVKTGDIDHDGQVDLIVGNVSDNGLSVLYNNRSTTAIPFNAFAANFSRFGTGGTGLDQKTSDLVVADFNGDLFDDVATANYRESGNVSIYINSKRERNVALKVPQSLTVGGNAGAIAAIDLDGDGDLDLVISNILDATLRMLKNDGAGNFSEFRGPLQVGAAPASIAVGNFDGAGGPDLAVANYGSTNVSLLLSNGSFSFASAVSLAVSTGAASVVAKDIDDDDDIDLIVTAGSNGMSGGVSLLHNRGDGTFGAAEFQAVGLVSGIPTFNVAVGKVDNDDLPDLVVTNGYDSEFKVFTNETPPNKGTHLANLATGLAGEVVGGLDFIVKQQVTAAPIQLHLLSSSDTGTSNTDDVTEKHTGLAFRIDGTVAGATVTLMVGGRLLGSATATGIATFITTNSVLADGVYSLSARQQLPGSVQSSAVSLSVKIVPAGGFALGAGGASNDEGRAIAVDPAGNSYVAGTLSQVDVSKDLETGNGRMFVASYSSTFFKRWQLPLVGNADNRALSIAFAQEGAASYVYVTGTFQGTLTFSPAIKLTAGVGKDIFIVKLAAANGAVVWAKSLDGKGATPDAGLAITPAAGNTVLITGQFSGTLRSTNIVGLPLLPSRGKSDVFVLKLNAGGTLNFLKRFGGSEDDLAKGLALDAGGNIYVTGSFAVTTGSPATANFDPVSTTNTAAKLTALGGGDAFLVKLTTNGTFAWARRWGGSEATSDEGRSVVVDNTDPSGASVYVAGYFLGANVDLNPTAGSFVKSSLGGSDAFVTKFKQSGAWVWSAVAGSAGSERAYDLAVRPDHSLAIVGQFNNIVDFNPSPNAKANLSAALLDGFCWTLNSSGALVSAQRLGANAIDLARSVASDKNGNLYVAGLFGSTMYVNAITITSTGGKNIFVAKLPALTSGVVLAAQADSQATIPKPIARTAPSSDAQDDYFTQLAEEE